MDELRGRTDAGSRSDHAHSWQGTADRPDARIGGEMKAVAQLAGGIAHDLNNLLGVIRGNADLALLDLEATAPIRFELEEIRQASMRAAALVSQLLAFSHRHVLHPGYVNLNTVITDDRGILERLMGPRIRVVVELDPDLGLVLVDPGQVHQVLLNLALNARDAMPDGGTLEIRTRNVKRLVQDTGAEGPAVREFVRISVSDTGHGIPSELRNRIFEPFFTTKEAGKGTGLGLSIVYGAVEQGRGSIEVQSEPGRGTTFHVFLPRATPAALAQPAAAPALEATRRSSGTILLVEDEAALRTLLRRILEREGYTVIEARSGEEALARSADLAVRIDLLLTDVILPGLSGRALALRMAEERPDLRVLFMSGYSDDVMRSHGVTGAGIELLRKPASEAEITSRVRALLEPE